METLVAGNVLYWTDETIKEAFGNGSVILCHPEHEDSRKGKIRWFSMDTTEDRFQRFFRTYGFDHVVYISDYLSYESTPPNELEKLRSLLDFCRRSKVGSFIYVCSDQICRQQEDSRVVTLRSMENLCRYYEKNFQIPVTIVRCPYLAGIASEHDYWRKVLYSVDAYGKWEFSESAQTHADFMAVEDLSRFLFRLIDVADPTVTTINLRSGFYSTFGDAAQRIQERYPKAQFTFPKAQVETDLNLGTDICRDKFDWSARVDVIQSMASMIRVYEGLHLRKPVEKKKHSLKSFLRVDAELLLGTLLVEVLRHYTRDQAGFAGVDLRLAFVAIIASLHGTTAGFAAVVIEIVSILAEQGISGASLQAAALDYRNWLTFVFLFVVAGVIGFMRERREDEALFIQEQNAAIQRQNDFITDLYQESTESRNEYKQNLIVSRDGFGRIFDVVKKLNTTMPEQIFAQSIPVMEDVLGNNSIAIYTINDKHARFARLEVSSRQISALMRKSINLENYAEVLRTLETDSLWINRNPQEGAPSYVAGIRNNEELNVLIMIYNVGYSQMSIYYANLIRVLSGLMESFIVRAWEYQRAVAARTYIEGTNIVNTDHFLRQVAVQQEMMEKQITSFRLFRFDESGDDMSSLTRLDDMLRSKIRSNDILGVGSDHKVYLLASQVDENSEQIVLKRFRELGLACTIVPHVGDAS